MAIASQRRFCELIAAEAGQFPKKGNHRMKAYHIYLLRHGVTQANEEGRYLGRTDVPLSEEGAAGIVALGRRYQYPKAEMFFSSPLTRCMQTLELLYPGCRPKPVPGLAECDFGEYEGKTISQLRNDSVFRDWVACGGRTAPPGGESSGDFQKRCCAAFETVTALLLSSGVGHAVIMTHGGVIMMLLGTFGYPRRPFYDWMTASGMGFEVILTPQIWMSGRVLEIAGRIPEGAGDSQPPHMTDVLRELGTDNPEKK